MVCHTKVNSQFVGSVVLAPQKPPFTQKNPRHAHETHPAGIFYLLFISVVCISLLNFLRLPHHHIRQTLPISHSVLNAAALTETAVRTGCTVLTEPTFRIGTTGTAEAVRAESAPVIAAAEISGRASCVSSAACFKLADQAAQAAGLAAAVRHITIHTISSACHLKDCRVCRHRRAQNAHCSDCSRCE